MASALERRYQLAQSQLKRQEAGRQAEEERAMRRQFAQAGAIGSGAAIKAGMEQRARGAERLQSGMLGLEAEKLGQQYQEEQAEKQRKFVTSERLGAQEFGASEAEKQRGFVTSERLGSQEFATGERLGAQEYASGEALKGREQEYKMFKESLEYKKGQDEITNAIAASQLILDKYISFENLNNARRTLGLPPVFGGLSSTMALPTPIEEIFKGKTSQNLTPAQKKEASKYENIDWGKVSRDVGSYIGTGWGSF